MATKASAQQTLIDLTDGYSVSLSNENYTWQGDTNGVSGTQSTTCLVQVFCGGSSVSSTIGEITDTIPDGLSISVGWADTTQTNPQLTITATSALTAKGSVNIPVVIQSTSGEITIYKTFSWTIAFEGQQGENGASVELASTAIAYQASSDGTNPPGSTTTWYSSVSAANAQEGQYLWTRTTVSYKTTDASGNVTTTETVSYSVSYIPSDGDTGTSVKSVSSDITYQASSDGESVPTGTWVSSVANAGVSAGQYLWTKTVVTYTLSDGTGATLSPSYSVAYFGTNGEDAITMTITSSNGLIFKNTSIDTVLTAHVYQSGAEISATEIAALGTINWYYEDTNVGTSQTLTVSGSDVSTVATYIAQLEG